VGGQQRGEVVGELLFAQMIDLLVESLTDAANGTGIGVDRLGLQARTYCGGSSTTSMARVLNVRAQW